ncbi:Rhomboid family protein [Lacunisphaera limnophila]|uniref:Rhomboid family protein n=1 Tax=Lacunisphaera limnophila TaxID=1838286 RepID=A0A1D8ASH0_9BACT|nr:rhombosortase [Lacunisphaera limnophila]AOS43844.1 Rhomboid family protein [Lacunisphaera limnophila]
MKTLRVPLLLFVLPAVLLAFAPARHGLVLLDRSAVAAGEVWRLWTGHWVHFSASHLGWNLAVLLAAGTWLERQRPGLLLRHTVIAAPLIGLAVLIGEPALQAYGGLSGLATSVVVLLGLHQLRSGGASRWLWTGLLALVAVKTTGDAIRAETSLVAFALPGVRLSTTAHFAGALSALLHEGLGCLRRSKMTPPGPVTGSRRQDSGYYP